MFKNSKNAPRIIDQGGITNTRRTTDRLCLVLFVLSVALYGLFSYDSFKKRRMDRVMVPVDYLGKKDILCSVQSSLAAKNLQKVQNRYFLHF